MAFIDVVSPQEASDELAEIYHRISGSRGGVAAVHQIQSLHPKAMLAHLELYKTIVLQRASLSRIARERIAVVVSAANRCAYCVAHHSEALRQRGEATEIADALEAGLIPESLDEPDRLLLGWAQKATRTPAECGEEDVQTLRAAGLDDRAILDASLTIGYFCFVNRLVLLLGVELEEHYAETCS